MGVLAGVSWFLPTVMFHLVPWVAVNSQGRVSLHGLALLREPVCGWGEGLLSEAEAAVGLLCQHGGQLSGHVAGLLLNSRARSKRL